jgi:hypothetical protein
LAGGNSGGSNSRRQRSHRQKQDGVSNGMLWREVATDAGGNLRQWKWRNVADLMLLCDNIRSKKQDDFDGVSNIFLPCPGS